MFNKKMPKFFLITLLILLPIFLLLFIITSGFGLIPNSFIYEIPRGYVDKYENYQEDGFQDYRDYAEYKYTEETKKSIVNNKKYKVMTMEDVSIVDGYFKNMGYYLRDIISEGDYVRIKTREGETIGNFTYGKYDKYTVYFFDVDSLTLFYIHTTY